MYIINIPKMNSDCQEVMDYCHLKGMTFEELILNARKAAGATTDQGKISAK